MYDSEKCLSCGKDLASLVVTRRVDNAHPLHDDYPLLPGDLVTKQPDGTYTKYAPGLAIMGFVIPDDAISTVDEYIAQRNKL